MNSTQITGVAIAALIGVNVATLAFHIKRDREWRRVTQAFEPRQLEQEQRDYKSLYGEENEAANSEEPQGGSSQGHRGQRQSALGVAVVAPDSRTGRMYVEQSGYRVGDGVAVCTETEHLRGRRFNEIHFIDFGWDHKRHKRGELAMSAEIIASRTGATVNYIPEIF